MSTVEKAFLKSKEQGSDQGIDIDLPSESSMKKDAKQLNSSQRSISNIEQLEKYSEKELKEKRLIYPNMGDKKTLSNYRNLRTKLLSLSQKDNFVTMISPVVSDPNACLVAANLAATFALDESKTSILIEANIDEPALNSTFDLEDKAGLSDYLSAENMAVENAMQKTRVPRLGLVPSGKLQENTAEYFSSNKMGEFVKELANRYPDRYPIINTSSLLDSAEARILLGHCDLVILVVPYAECSQEDILRASVLVGSDKLAGLVLSDF